MTRIDLEALRASASSNMGDVLTAIGSELARWAKPDRGRARCPFGCGSTGFPLSYADGRARCHYEAKSWSAVDLVAEKYGLGFREAAERLSDILGGSFAEACGRPRTSPPSGRRSRPGTSEARRTSPAAASGTVRSRTSSASTCRAPRPILTSRGEPGRDTGSPSPLAGLTGRQGTSHSASSETALRLTRRRRFLSPAARRRA